MKNNIKRDIIKFDVIIIGAGPSGLSAAIKIKKLEKKFNKKISVCILEKSNIIGGHIISGAIINFNNIKNLFSKININQIPIETIVKNEIIYILSKKKSYKIPYWIIPKSLKNNNNYIISLSNFIIWLSNKAKELGIEIFTNSPVNKILYKNNGSVKGVIINDIGLDINNKKKSNFQFGIEIHSKFTIFAEGARGNLGKKVIYNYNLNFKKNPQNYAIGIKEIWKINPKFHKLGLIIHTLGWPLKKKNYGGSFIYHINNYKISIGYIIGLSYDNPYLSPYEEFQKYKTHPKIKKILYLGKRISYGAKSINLGGLYSLPKFIFPGGAIIGCNAGFLNSSSLKGNHTAIESGILLGESIFEILYNNFKSNKLKNFINKFKYSSLYQELYKSRNFNFFMKKSLFFRLILIGIDQIIFRGYSPIKLNKIYSDYKYLKLAKNVKKIFYPKHDNKITFNKSSSIFLSNIKHKKNQPIHLKIKNKKIPININLNLYAGLEERYCPGGVYEFINNFKKKIKLKINSENCLHCKCCDIKDPKQNIIWNTPEEESGPNYINM